MKVKVAAIQASPVYMNLEASLEKAVSLIAEASSKGAQFIAFPETWLPGYPTWLDSTRDVGLWDHAPVKKVHARLRDNSLVVPSDQTAKISAMAKDCNVVVNIGAHEKVTEGPGRGTLYNTMLTFGSNGEILNKHRKVMPTHTERLVWGQGDGKSIRAVETEVGRVGGLICWEHWMPLARQTLHNSGEDIHVAAWPLVKEMSLIASRHYAFEGRCFVIATGSIMHARDLPEELEAIEPYKSNPDEIVMRGGTAIIAPNGDVVSGPVFNDETILIEELDLSMISEESLALDVTGHYSRADIFKDI